MCSVGQNLTPAAAHLVGELLVQLRDALAREAGCDPEQVVIGPVDLDPPEHDPIR